MLIKIKEIFPGQHEHGKGNQRWMKWISSDATKDLLADNNGDKCAGDDQPPWETGGKSIPSKSPISAALPSAIEILLLVIRFINNSQMIAVDTESDTTPTAGIPYWNRPKTTAGNAASIIL